MKFDLNKYRHHDESKYKKHENEQTEDLRPDSPKRDRSKSRAVKYLQIKWVEHNNKILSEEKAVARDGNFPYHSLPTQCI